MEASWIALIVVLSIVGAIAVAAIVVGAIALDKANQDATPAHVTVTIPIISPVNKTQTGTAQVTNTGTLPTAPQVVTFPEAFLSIPTVITKATSNLSGAPCVTKDSAVTETGFTTSIISTAFNGISVHAGTNVLSLIEVTDGGVKLPAILYEDTDLYYILAKDVAGLTWNTPAKVNSGGYVAGTGDLLIVNDLPTVVYLATTTSLVVAHGTDMVWSTSATANATASIPVLSYVSSVVMPTPSAVQGEIGVYVTQDVSGAITFNRTSDYGATWAGVFPTGGVAVGTVPAGTKTGLSAAVMPNTVPLIGVLSGDSAAGFYFFCSPDATGAGTYAVPTPNPVAVSKSDAPLKLTSVLHPTGGTYVPVVSASDGTNSYFLIADTLSTVGASSWTASEEVKLGSSAGGSTLGQCLGSSSDILSVYVDAAGVLRYNVVTQATRTNAEDTANAADIDPFQTGHGDVDVAVIDSGVAFAFQNGTDVWYLRPITGTIAVDTNYTVGYSATGLLL